MAKVQITCVDRVAENRGGEGEGRVTDPTKQMNEKAVTCSTNYG